MESSLPATEVNVVEQSMVHGHSWFSFRTHEGAFKTTSSIGSMRSSLTFCSDIASASDSFYDHLRCFKSDSIVLQHLGRF